MIKKWNVLMTYDKTINTTAFLANYLIPDKKRAEEILLKTYLQYNYDEMKRLKKKNVSEQDYLDGLLLERMIVEKILSPPKEYTEYRNEFLQNENVEESSEEMMLSEEGIRADIDDLIRMYFTEKAKSYRAEAIDKKDLRRKIILGIE